MTSMIVTAKDGNTYKTTQVDAKEKKARIKCALDILCQMNNGTQVKWMEFVEYIRKKVDDERMIRGVGERPILKPCEEYKNELNIKRTG